MSRLDRIQVKGFKSIREMDLELRNINVLIGANGSGKSNFVSLFDMLSQFRKGELQLYVSSKGGADRILHFGRKTTNSLVISFEGDLAEDRGSHRYNAELKPTNDNRLIFAKEQWLSIGNPVATGQPGAEESIFSGPYSFPMMFAPWALRPLFEQEIYHFHDTSDTARIKSTGDIHDNAPFKSDASNLAAFLYMLQETKPEHFKRIVDTIRLSAPFIREFNLRPDPLAPDSIRLEWTHKGSKDYFNAYQLSDGTLRFISLTTLLLQPDPPSLIIIDEPELGLHPFAIVLLASMIRSVSTERQIIISTQSVTLIDQFTPEDIIVVEREGDQSVFKRPSTQELDDWLDEYSLGEIWEKNIIGGRP